MDKIADVICRTVRTFSEVLPSQVPCTNCDSDTAALDAQSDACSANMAQMKQDAVRLNTTHACTIVLKELDLLASHLSTADFAWATNHSIDEEEDVRNI